MSRNLCKVVEAVKGIPPVRRVCLIPIGIDIHLDSRPIPLAGLSTYSLSGMTGRSLLVTFGGCGERFNAFIWWLLLAALRTQAVEVGWPTPVHHLSPPRPRPIEFLSKAYQVQHTLHINTYKPTLVFNIQRFYCKISNLPFSKARLLHNVFCRSILS